MNTDKSISYDLLFRDYNFENTESVLPLVKKCLTESRDETEVGRALEIALCFSLKNFSSSELEEKLFRIACPTAKNFVLHKLQYLEKNPKMYFEYLACVLKVVTYFQGVFEYLCEVETFTFVEVKSLLLATSDILYSCYSHCKMSEEVYGSILSSATEYLNNFFKNCCSLQEQLLNFMSEKSKCEIENDRDSALLVDVLAHLSKCGVVLIQLEVKTMAKVWKTFIFLIQRYLPFLKDSYNIEETISHLCSTILSHLENALCKNIGNIPKVIKLSCFLLKLIIKLCEAFKGCLKSCQKELLSLLLMLCLCDARFLHKSVESETDEVLNQLTVGIDPLLTQLIADKELVKECNAVNQETEKTVQFVILCCLILKKLMESNGAARSLWLNNDENILEWIFNSASSSEFITCDIHLPNILVNGKHKKFSDLYEYALVSSCVFLITASAEEYRLAEKSLITNVLQMEPVRALLAIDIWCLLARFADSELCLTQILALGKIFEEFTPATTRPEKWYLGSLIKRLFSLLAKRHRETFFKAFKPSMYSALWSGKATNGLTLREACDVRRSLVAEVDRLLDPLGADSSIFGAEHMSVLYERLPQKIAKLWKFDCDILSSRRHNVRFLRVCCVLTACIVAEIPSEHLLLILTQMRKLLSIGQPTTAKLYFASVLGALSSVHIPPNDNQKKTIVAIADSFRALLSSPEALAKQKAFNVFSAFSHATSHPEVISLSVQHSAGLKLEMADYFKTKTSERTDWNDYFRELYRLRFEHICEEENAEVTTPSKRMKLSPDTQQIVIRWKEDARKLVEHYQALPSAQKTEIKNICNSILSLS